MSAEEKPMTTIGAQRKAIRDMMDLGTVLLRMCWVGEDQLKVAVSRHRENGVRLGETLVQMGALTTEQLTEALELQKQLRGGQEREGMTRILEHARAEVRQQLRNLSDTRDAVVNRQG